MALRVLGRRPAWPVAMGYIASVTVLGGWYPALRFDALRKAYLAIELAAGFVGFGALVLYRRTKPGKADVAVRVAAVLICGHLAAMLTGPYRVGFFGEAWAIAQLAYIAIFAAVILLQLGEVLTHSEP